MTDSTSNCLFRPKAGRPKNQEKREQILCSAAELFLLQGFSSTSMDLVAKHASVSKQTVYSHFSNKDALFRAVIDMKCKEYQMDAEHLNAQHLTLEQILFHFGEHLVSLLHDERVIAMNRVVIAEAASNPHVAELFYEAGPENAMSLLTNALLTFSQFKHNKKRAAFWTITFSNLLKSDFHMRSLIGLPFKLSDAEQKSHVQESVKQLLVLMRYENQ